MLLALATAMAQYVVLTNWFLLDVAAFLRVLPLCICSRERFSLPSGSGNTRMRRTMPYIWPSPATVSRFTTRRRGFAVRACVRPAAAAGGVRLILPHTSYFIPEWAMEQPTQFRSVLGL